MESISIKFNKEKIRARMLKNAARIWNVEEDEIENTFDPVISMLIEGCVNEVKKLSDEIDNTQSRILSRLAQLLTPDSITCTFPSYSILNCMPSEYDFEISKQAQFLTRKKSISKTNATQEVNNEIYFSPLTPFRLVDGQVKYLATNSQLFECSPFNKKLVAETESNKTIESGVIWIGLELNKKISSLENISFFFDWRSNTSKYNYLKNLINSHWKIGNISLNIQQGIISKKQTPEQLLNSEYDVITRIEREVDSFYKTNFISIAKQDKSIEDLSALKCNYPPNFIDVFSEKNLQSIKGELLWIKVECPKTMPPEVLSDIHCSINSLPVINRKWNHFSFRINDGLNLVALNTEQEFLAIERVDADNGFKYMSNPLTNSTNNVEGTYILRHGGVERFDARNATQFLNYLTDLLRDESAAFSVLGNDFLTAGIKQLNQTIAQLEQKISLNSTKQNPSSYLIINPHTKSDNIFISFWSTFGEFANQLRAGTKLEYYSGAEVVSASPILLTATQGGKNKLNDLEKLSTYKLALVSRDRIVTLNDIKIFCENIVGNIVTKIDVRKTIADDINDGIGFRKIIEIELTPSVKILHSTEEWTEICHKLQTELEERSSMLIPFKIIISHLN